MKDDIFIQQQYKDVCLYLSKIQCYPATCKLAWQRPQHFQMIYRKIHADPAVHSRSIWVNVVYLHVLKCLHIMSASAFSYYSKEQTNNL